MSGEKDSSNQVKTVVKENSAAGAVYGIGLIGAIAYALLHVDSFWDLVVGLLVAFFWPAVLVYKALELFGF